MAYTSSAVHVFLFKLQSPSTDCLSSAIVTHKGASADGGHYIGWVKKTSLTPPESGKEEAEQWYKFDDDKVSVIDQEKITSLDGGGEDSTAYILLYRSGCLPCSCFVSDISINRSKPL